MPQIATYKENRVTCFIFNNFGKLLLFSCVPILAILCTTEVKSEILYTVIFAIFVAIYITVLIFSKKLAVELTFDNEKKEISAILSRNNGTVILKYKDISSVYLNGYVLFKTRSREIMFKNITEKSIYEHINQFNNIRFGPIAILEGQKSNLTKQ